MLIRIRGGTGGIKEYLEDGQKKDRFYSRDELDERVILDGDLWVTNEIINSIDTDTDIDKYFHITLAFKEDYLEPEILIKINQEFREYFLANYSEDEINYYAEAHLPKIKSYVSRSDNQLIERKPHIHIVIPRTNLLSGNSFNPSIKRITKYIDSFQEHINAKYGLESPKDNLRTNLNDKSQMLSRYKGDNFAGKGREEKATVLDLIIKNNPINMEQLKSLLIENGYEVKVRNKTELESSYLNIKQAGDSKGINLKDSVFLDEFLSLPLEVKLNKLNPSNPDPTKYIQPAVSRETPAIHQQNMQEWINTKSLETKLINRNTSKSERKLYYKLPQEDKATYLNQKQKEFYTNHNNHNNFLEDDQNGRDTTTIAADVINVIRSNNTILDDIKTDIKRIGDIEIGNSGAKLRKSIARASEERYRAHSSDSEANEQYTAKDSVVEQLLQESKEKNKQYTYKNYLSELNGNVHADVLLELTEKTHGINLELYVVTKNLQGSDRIKCGNRNVSVVDFCLKELNLSFKDTIKLLDNTYNMQNDLNRARGWSIKQDIYLREKYQEWFKNYRESRLNHFKQTANQVKDARRLIISKTKDKINAVRDDRNITPAKRKEQINILKAAKVIDLNALAKAREEEQKSIREAFNLEMQASYRKFLSEQAKLGDEVAIEELRRLKIKFEPTQSTTNSFKYVDHYKEFRLNISHEIDNDGNIYYKLDDQIIIKDTGKKVELIQDTDDNVKLSLDLAMAKFGKNIELTGTAEFRQKVVEMAIKNNYKVEFLDEYSKKYHISCLAEANIYVNKFPSQQYR